MTHAATLCQVTACSRTQNKTQIKFLTLVPNASFAESVFTWFCKFFPRLERKNVWIMAAAPHREVCALWHTHHESAAIHPAEFVQTCSNFGWTVVLKITEGYQKHSGIAYQSRSWASAATIWSYARHSVLRVKPWCHGHFHVVTSMQETASCTQAALDPDYFARGSHPDLPSKSICSPCSFATSSSV